MPWSAIAYVSSGITLVAFVAATTAWVLRLVVLQRERMIRAAPEAARAELVAQALESFHINTENLTKAQQYDLAVRQISERAGRFRLVAMVIVAVTVVAAGVSVPAIINRHPDDRKDLLAGLSADMNTYFDRVRNICENIRLKRVTEDEIKQLAPQYNLARQTLMRTDELHRQEIRTQWTGAAVMAYDKVMVGIFGPTGIDALVYEMNRSSVDKLREKQLPDYDALSAQHRKLAEQVVVLETALHDLYAMMGAEAHLEKTFILLDEIKKAGS